MLDKWIERAGVSICTLRLDSNHFACLLVQSWHTEFLSCVSVVYFCDSSPILSGLKKFQWIGKSERERETAQLVWADFRELNSMGKADRPGRRRHSERVAVWVEWGVRMWANNWLNLGNMKVSNAHLVFDILTMLFDAYVLVPHDDRIRSIHWTTFYNPWFVCILFDCNFSNKRKLTTWNCDPKIGPIHCPFCHLQNMTYWHPDARATEGKTETKNAWRVATTFLNILMLKYFSNIF